MAYQKIYCENCGEGPIEFDFILEEEGPTFITCAHCGWGFPSDVQLDALDWIKIARRLTGDISRLPVNCLSDSLERLKKAILMAEVKIKQKS